MDSWTNAIWQVLRILSILRFTKLLAFQLKWGSTATAVCPTELMEVAFLHVIEITLVYHFTTNMTLVYLTFFGVFLMRIMVGLVSASSVLGCWYKKGSKEAVPDGHLWLFLFCPKIHHMVLTIQTIGIREIICRHSYGTLTWSGI